MVLSDRLLENGHKNIRSPHEDGFHSHGCMAWKRRPSGVTKISLQVGLHYSKPASGLCQIGAGRNHVAGGATTAQASGVKVETGLRYHGVRLAGQAMTVPALVRGSPFARMVPSHQRAHLGTAREVAESEVALSSS